jgi:hypothetical protein
LRNRSIFDQTKIRLSGTNLLDQHTVQSNSLAGTAAATLAVPGSCTTSTGAATACINPFLTAGPTPINGADTPSLMAGRSFSISVTFGFAPEGKK